MMVIGLTGGIASGKTTVANLFKEHGVCIVDTDIIARQLVEPNTKGLNAIVEHFGQDILTDEQRLNRRKLRQIIFEHPKDKQWLESLLHPLIREEMAQQLAECHSPYAIAVIPLLIETVPNPYINKILVVDTPEPTQLTRLIERDNLTEAQALAIINSQISREKRLEAADYVIENHTGLTTLAQQVQNLHQKICSLR